MTKNTLEKILVLTIIGEFLLFFSCMICEVPFKPYGQILIVLMWITLFILVAVNLFKK